MVFDQINSVFVKKTTFKKHNWLQHNNLWIALTWELIQFESWEYNNLSAEFETHHYKISQKDIKNVCFFYLKQSIIWYLNSLFGATHKPVLQQHNTKTQHNTSNMSKPASAQHTTRCIPSSFRTTYNTNNNKMFLLFSSRSQIYYCILYKSSCCIALTELGVRRFFDSKPLQTQTEHFSDELVPHVLLSSWPRLNTALNASRAWKEAGHVDFSGSGTSVWTEYAFIGTVFLKAD